MHTFLHVIEKSQPVHHHPTHSTPARSGTPLPQGCSLLFTAVTNFGIGLFVLMHVYSDHAPQWVEMRLVLFLEDQDIRLASAVCVASFSAHGARRELADLKRGLCRNEDTLYPYALLFPSSFRRSTDCGMAYSKSLIVGL